MHFWKSWFFGQSYKLKSCNFTKNKPILRFLLLICSYFYLYLTIFADFKNSYFKEYLLMAPFC